MRYQLNLDYDIEWYLSGRPYLTTDSTLKDIVVKSIKKETGIDADKNAKGGTSDGRFMTAMDAEIVELGPLNESIHKIDENVSLNDLKILRDIYINLLKNITT